MRVGEFKKTQRSLEYPLKDYQTRGENVHLGEN